MRIQHLINLLEIMKEELGEDAQVIVINGTYNNVANNIELVQSLNNGKCCITTGARNVMSEVFED